MVIYVLLFAALRLFAVPVILVLLYIQGKNDPHGQAEFKAYLKEQISKCEDWFWKAFRGGVYFAANNHLGQACFLGQGVPQDYAKAVEKVLCRTFPTACQCLDFPMAARLKNLSLRSATGCCADICRHLIRHEAGAAPSCSPA